MTRVLHTLEPIYSPSSRTLILGSMPSVTSRQVSKYYGHPQNRFWRILATLYDEEIGDWQEFILKHDLALWDVIASCEITASADSSIKKVEVNDIPWLLAQTEITHIFTLGKKAYDLYGKYLNKQTGIEAIYLPSPSPANATMSLEKLVELYGAIKEVTDD